jgi:hypothetical protein
MNGSDLTSNVFALLPRNLGALVLGIILLVSVTVMGVLHFLKEHAPTAPPPPPPPTHRIVEFKVDNCQYLALRNTSGTYSITHKGNCTNEFHKTQIH